MNKYQPVTRDEALEELDRIIRAREAQWPELVKAGKLDAAEADRRNARLSAAWSIVHDSGVVVTSPIHRDLALGLSHGIAQPPASGEKK